VQWFGKFFRKYHSCIIRHFTLNVRVIPTDILQTWNIIFMNKGELHKIIILFFFILKFFIPCSLVYQTFTSYSNQMHILIFIIHFSQTSSKYCSVGYEQCVFSKFIISNWLSFEHKLNINSIP